MKVFRAELFSSESKGALGEILPDPKRLLIQGNGGILSVELLQMEGKKEMDARSFLNGAKGLPGKRVE